jgi:3-hydroxybutyryl-CoA dehydrogenase
VRVAVLGAGTMGSGIAQVCALAGHDVRLRDVDDARVASGLAAITNSLNRMEKSGRLDDRSPDDVANTIIGTTRVDEAADAADVVIEAVPERLDIKHDVLSAALASARPDALIGTNTSQLSITSIGAALGAASVRLVGMHFFNPPVMMRLVELVRGLDTSDETVSRATTFAEGLGKEVVVCRKDSPGFLTSRMSAILRMEAMRMLDEGLGTAEDIDKATRLAFNHPMGPLELGDFNGLDTYLDALEGLARAHGERFAPPVSLKNMVAAGRLGRKSGSGFYRYDTPTPQAGT